MYFVKTSDDINLAVYDYNPKGKKTVLLIHGWPLSHLMYEYQLEMLISCGYRVITMDLRGFGNSDVPAGGYCYDQMAEDIYKVVCALRLNRFTLAGFSMGGAIVLRYMREFQGYGVERLILLAAAAPSWTRREGFPYGLTREYVNGLIREACTDRPRLACKFSHEQLFASCQSEPLKNWFEDIALSASGIGTVQAAIALRDEDGRNDLKAVEVPTVIIHGKKDVVVSSQLAEYQHMAIQGSKLYELENSGHCIVYDELERFNDLFLMAVEGKC